ncbi:MAG: hypothetical protein IJ580_01545, partial [Prevotella sp.]|nr:hypothetical protein [Prevotella sp.]
RGKSHADIIERYSFMRVRTISIFRGLHVYVLSTSKPLPKGGHTVSIATVSSPLVPPEISTEE